MWQADRDDGASPSVYGDTCAALNFSDYNRVEAAAFAAESSGDTKISTCRYYLRDEKKTALVIPSPFPPAQLPTPNPTDTTYSYDAAWTTFIALHCAIEGCIGGTDKTTKFLRDGTSFNATGDEVTSADVLAAMFLVDFYGSSGRVQYDQGVGTVRFGGMGGRERERERERERGREGKREGGIEGVM